MGSRRIPVDVEALWREWLGSIRWDRIQQSNLALVRTMPSASARILDGENESLSKYATQLFYLLQLSGVFEYEGTNLLSGALCDGRRKYAKRRVA